MMSLISKSTEQLQPICLGANKFALKAQFGDLEAMKVGLEYERRNTSIQVSLNQLDQKQKVQMIEFYWWKYENADT